MNRDPLVTELLTDRLIEGLRQEDVVNAMAEMCGTKPLHISVMGKWENGVTTPRLDHLRAWGAVLGKRLVWAPIGDPTEEGESVMGILRRIEAAVTELAGMKGYGGPGPEDPGPVVNPPKPTS